jgi:hypothetical protein
MRIEPSEIAEVQDAGELDGSPVKLVRTKGGFWIATGRPMGKSMDQALSAGSHPAIVRYNVEKQFPTFRPAMMKSLAFGPESLVLEHTDGLSEELKKSGHELYTVQTGDKVEAILALQGMKIADAVCVINGDCLQTQKINMNSEHVVPLAHAMAQKAMMLNIGFRPSKA